MGHGRNLLLFVFRKGRDGAVANKLLINIKFLRITYTYKYKFFCSVGSPFTLLCMYCILIHIME